MMLHFSILIIFYCYSLLIHGFYKLFAYIVLYLIILSLPLSFEIYQCQNICIKEHTKKLLSSQENPARKTVEAAYRYLVRSHEILESAHGPSHPAVATGCLAAASVLNILEVYPGRTYPLIVFLYFLYFFIFYIFYIFLDDPLKYCWLYLGH